MCQLRAKIILHIRFLQKLVPFLKWYSLSYSVVIRVYIQFFYSLLIVFCGQNFLRTFRSNRV